MASQTAAVARGVISASAQDARVSALGLYRAWSRQIPFIIELFRLDKTEEECRAKLKEKFLINKNVQDVRQIDMLVIKGKMELEETLKVWKQTTHVMRFFEDPQTNMNPPKPFMDKFLDGR
ncbi:uncharacterized protein MONBRDRAFT_37277 [Monosiga brevicollis MX1]|uniref:NADH dehydrogenase [ubiquinone] 1 alpha subcomplex subunit 6 n=1 Tax=Monosiga brevicollis TaxID=81824 RepID=A9V0R3_MONBE|nr:uncharacterized protein MONBRDRAFT_37277 [Monosiga brevicollis MX1]EDQ88799.1 predicted protein [Monosiga brevicollis MX1]|eukprot:XP_001746412.1 hypothetical protein [Monosiga brevicollis MX1]